MAVEVRAYTLTIPAGTTADAPVVEDCSFPPRVVDAIQVIVPPGSSGLVGWCVMNSRVRVIPYDSDLWIVTAGESISWPLERQITSGSWQVAGYNTGIVDHKVYFRFLLSLVGDRQPLAPVMMDDSVLSPLPTDLSV